MSDHGILFSAPMVRALWGGRKTQTRRLRQPSWDAGDLLWVRENYRFGAGYDGVKPSKVPADLARVLYEANAPHPPAIAGGLRPSIYMPRWASRLTLRCTAVRVERLHDISYEDCRDEGVTCAIHGDRPHVACTGLRQGYEDLWVRLNGRESWDANPDVWVTEFEVIRGNIDAVKELIASAS